MEKPLGSYEYLVKYENGVEIVNTQQDIVIVHENEELLIDDISENKPIQYVAEAGNVKVLSSIPCPMYDVSQQPVYFDIHDSTELIPISVNSIQPEEPPNMFINNYLLSNSSEEMVKPKNDIAKKQDIVPYLKLESQSIDVDANKIADGYAEITITDEQYEILKLKGWILLEIKDEVFLLDSSGLHDITNDHELIMRLKQEANHNNILDSNNQSQCSMVVLENPDNENINTDIVSRPENSDQTEPMEIINETDIDQQGENSKLVQRELKHITENLPLPVEPQKEKNSLSNDINVVKTKEIHLKTQYLLKDIPKEIILGNTVNGKKLIARVAEDQECYKDTSKSNMHAKTEVGRDRNINDKQFAKLIQQVLLGTATNCRMEDISAAETVMYQMFKVPELRSNLHKHNLIITRTLREENADGLIKNQTEPTIVTGRFITNGSEGEFVHIPDMLQQHMKNSEREKYDDSQETIEAVISEGDIFLHVNITETKDVNHISISVTVNKRYLSLSQVYNMKSKHINAVFACTACAKVFKTEEDLEDHIEDYCTEMPVLLPDNNQTYTIIKRPNEEKLYVCDECKTQFVKLKECQEHLKIHSGTISASSAKYAQSSSDKKQNIFKCKMCSKTYFHSSSLTKHILTKHINPKKKPL